ncbi:hypothetical protein AGMMS49928_09000 [Spirochaetia bacterium]|nr:hypothetical protein AGMMS49928_09000 [Spirochaetia bacterium]
MKKTHDDVLSLFARYMADISAGSPLAADRPLRWTIITNPRAGGFTIKSRWKKHHEALRRLAAYPKAPPKRFDAAPSRTAQTMDMDKENSDLGKWGLIPTRMPGHAEEITRTLLDEMNADAASSSPFHLIIAAGGDGTSREILTVLAAAPEPLRTRCVILRLPLGTGNDGADAWDLESALQLLLGPGEAALPAVTPAVLPIEFQRSLRLTCSSPGKGPFPAFNVLSVGLDAFVTHNTNRVKGKMPGDSYKLWVDIAALFYDKIFKVGPMELRAFDADGKECACFTEKILLAAMGISGGRTYGSNNKILPDNRNVCAIKQMSVFRKIALKGQFPKGTHIHAKEAILFNAHRIELRGENPILAQMDGETVLLEPKDFPISIELTPPLIPAMKRRK